MGRSPCCAKVGLNRGAWTATEDRVLTDYVKVHGEGKWRNLPKKAGLKRCGKSCRLRWLNYLKPDIKRGNITVDEEELIVRLHKLLGNRWSLIAGRLPGRTDNEIKNYWNTKIGKKFKNNKEYHQNANPSHDDASRTGHRTQEQKPNPTIHRSTTTVASPIRTKASRCRKVIVPQELILHDGREKQQFEDDRGIKSSVAPSLAPNSTVSAGNSTLDKSLPVALEEDISSQFLFDFETNEQFLTDILNMDFSEQVDNFASWAPSSTDDTNTFDQVGLLSPSANCNHTLLASDNILQDDDMSFPTVASIKDDQAGLELEWLQD